MFSKTFAHENSKNEIRRRHRWRWLDEKSEYENEYRKLEKEVPSVDGEGSQLAEAVDELPDEHIIHSMNGKKNI